MRYTVLAALLAGTAAANNFTIVSPPSRGYDPIQAANAPCGGFNQPSTASTVAAQSDLQLTVPGGSAGSIFLFYLPGNNNDTAWQPLGNVTVSSTDTTVTAKVNYNGKASPHTNGTVQATFYPLMNTTDAQVLPLFQCADVQFGDDVNASESASDGSLVRHTFAAATLTLLAALVQL
ncbi:hypothetical protein IWQ60_012012 [Tieghemiomyces parasiticus]|uniref:Copper acquisition factor BIM1-like domain-containing protein n=1 Tax=Tieghemiomyces parasiticus TaxID=78921 RepID=A0A9W8DLR4_9FUNG|nr:hypothetical protein IWQ60_012012 [Tieghemiomyces parasiticus]